MKKSRLSANYRIVGRAAEKRELEALLASGEPEFLAVYGRRRVGKTFLVRSFFEPKTKFFELAGRPNGTMRDHLRLFAESFGEAFQANAGIVPPESWHDAFRTLQKAAEPRPARGQKLVLFFDEVPWLATPRSGFLEELELFWNRYASRRPHVLLIVCGSAASWMLRKIVHARGGLHRRLTRTMRLRPFSLPESRAYLEYRGLSLTLSELTELYMVLGGIPHYLRLVERGQSVAQNVDRLCFGRAAPLRNEAEEVFASLFKNASNHQRLVDVLARERRGMPANIALEAAHITSGGGATRVLTALEEAGFVTSYVPFGRNARDRLVRLSDPFSLFARRWMRSSRVRQWAQLRGTPAWRAWSGLSFETVCLDHVAAIRQALGISGVRVEASPWHHHAKDDAAQGAQIDLLLDRADNVISVCEMKFSEQPFVIDKRCAEELKTKLSVFREQTGTKKALRLVLISAQGLKRSKWSDELIDSVVSLDDLFATTYGLA